MKKISCACGWLPTPGAIVLLDEQGNAKCPKCGKKLDMEDMTKMENDRNTKLLQGELLTTSNELVTEKLTVYLDVVSLFTSFTDPKIQRQVAKSPQKQEALGQQMAKIGMRLALIGADAVVKGYCEFRMVSQQEGAKSENIVRCFGDLILKMRADLYGTQTCTVDDMLGTFIVGMA